MSDARHKLKFVICGIEHSGTTLVSDIFRQVPGLDSGFETGVLLCQSPREFLGEMPFADWILGNWAITQAELEMCCDTNSFAEFYARLGAASKNIEPGFPGLFDKTPRYLSQLEACLARVDVPFVVTYKDPRSIVFSDFSRSGAAAFEPWYDTYLGPKLGYMRHLYEKFQRVALPDKRVFCVSLESLCMFPRTSCEAIFAHCGEHFRLNYLLLKNLRYHHTRSTSISPAIPFEYLDGLSRTQIARIEKDFAEFDSWIYA